MSLKEQFGKDVLLTGWGHSRFGKLTEETLESLIVQVATEAISSAGIEPGQIDEIYLGQFNSGMMPLAFPSSLALQVSPDLANVAATRVENACASGSAAFQQGTKSLLAGTARTVLVIGAEKMTHAGADVVGAALLGADYDMAATRPPPDSRDSLPTSRSTMRSGTGTATENWATSWAPSRRRTTATGWTTPMPSSARTWARSSAAPSRTRTPGGGSAAPHRLLPSVRRRRRRRAVRVTHWRYYVAGTAGRFRPRQRLLPRRAAGPHRLCRHPRVMAPRAGDGRRRAGRPGFRRSPRLLHHRRTGDV